jgi:hypothetical protein
MPKMSDDDAGLRGADPPRPEDRDAWNLWQAEQELARFEREVPENGSADRDRWLAEGALNATGIFTLTLVGDRIGALSRFESSVLPWFGLPRELPAN